MAASAVASRTPTSHHRRHGRPTMPTAPPPADAVQTADDWVSLGGTVSADLYDQLGSMSPVPNTVRDGMVAGATIVDTDAAGHPQPEDKTRQLLAQTYGR
jgi:hypothetical protein